MAVASAIELLIVVADASLTRMPKFGWTARAGRKSLGSNFFRIGTRGQSDVGMWLDVVSAPT
jgi:hypothetical protein